MKNEQLRRKLKASAKRRAKRTAPSTGQAASADDARRSPADRPASSSGAVVTPSDLTFSSLVKVVLQVADSLAGTPEDRMNARAVFSACRAYLRFTEPREHAARTLCRRWATLQRDSDFEERAFRQSVTQLMDRAQQHSEDPAQDDGFLEYLRIVQG